jgi:hypothetical protein
MRGSVGAASDRDEATGAAGTLAISGAMSETSDEALVRFGLAGAAASSTWDGVGEGVCDASGAVFSGVADGTGAEAFAASALSTAASGMMGETTDGATGAIIGRGGQAGSAATATSSEGASTASDSMGAASGAASPSLAPFIGAETAATRPANRASSAAVSTVAAFAPTGAVGAIRDMTLSADMRGGRAFAGWAPTALGLFETAGARSGPSCEAVIK